MADPYRSHYANGEAVDAALDSGVAAQSEVAGARGSYGNLNARLSAIDTSLSNKANSSNVYTKTQVDNALNDKVSKVTGKGLSTNDYTTVEKTKLAGLQNYDDSVLSGRVTATESSISTLNGGASTSGSVANSVAAGVSDAKGYTDTEIGKLDAASVGGAGKYIKSISQTDGKITAVEETMDTSPTASSTKAVTSGGVQSAIASEATARQNADTSQTDLLIELINSGPKNLLNPTRASSSNYGARYTSNGDGTYTVYTNGATTVYYSYRIIGNSDTTGYAYGIPIPRGKYILSGVPSGANTSNYRYIFGIMTSSEATRQSLSLYADYEFEVTNDTTRIDLSIYLPASANIPSPGVTFKPMLCLKKFYEATEDYVPYSPSNAELAAQIKELRAALST